MKNLDKRTWISIFIIVCCISIFIIILFNVKNIDKISVFAEEKEEIYTDEKYYLEAESLGNMVQNKMNLLASGERSNNAVLISGTSNNFAKYPISDFTNIKYIPNAYYFLINPWHHNNDMSDNASGTCTTVAMQLLLGYHNYYSDRRLIPETGGNYNFLAQDYGDIYGSPAFQRANIPSQENNANKIGMGCQRIGTANGVYSALFDLTWNAHWAGVGQAIPLVKNGATKFLETYSPTDARNGVSMSWGLITLHTVISELEAGRPVMLGMHPLNDGSKFHVVIAYGRARLDGVDGFLVHYGWGKSATQVWVPSDWFAFQLTMSVDHQHNLIDTGKIIRNTHRELICSECGFKTVDNLYKILDSAIVGVNYPLTDVISIPSSINLYFENTASFNTIRITEIAQSAFKNQDQIKELVLPSTITIINSSAFDGCTNLEYINLPKSLEKIGKFAFLHCEKLKEINIPSKVKIIEESSFSSCFNLTQVTFNNDSQLQSIENGAFSLCINLSEIIIPSSVQKIGSEAFSACNKIASFTIPNSVETIGSAAFKGWGYKQIIYVEDRLGPPDEGWALWDKECNAKVFWLHSSYTAGLKFTLTTNVNGEKVYQVSADTDLDSENVIIPNNYGGYPVTIIANSAFYQNKNIRTIYIPNTIEYIERQAFAECSNLSIVSFQENSQLLSIGGSSEVIYGAFYDCESLKNINIPASVVEIKSNAFAYSGLEKINFESDSQLETIGSMAFSDCENLTSIKIPKSVVTIDKNAFYYCGIVEIEFEADSKLKNIMSSAFCGSKIKEITIPENITKIEHNVFSFCSQLEKIELPENLLNIDAGAFSFCYKLYQINIPSSVKHVAKDAFDYTKLWEDATNNEVFYVDGWAIKIKGTIPNKVVLSKGTRGIADRAFDGNTEITSIIMPSGMIVGSEIFDSEATLTVYAEDLTQPEEWAENWNASSQPVYWGSELSSDGNIYRLNSTEDGYILHGFEETKTTIAIPSVYKGMPVKEIANSGFKDFTLLTEISIPEGIEKIGNEAFYKCTNLTNIVLPGSVTTIGAGAFALCPITEIEIPKNVTVICNKAFAYCTDLVTIEFATGSKLESIGDSAFTGCTNLVDFTIPESVTEIGEQAFYKCSALKKMSIPAGVTIIESETFSKCTNLEEILFAENALLEIIENYAFGDTKIAEVTLPANLKYLDGTAFAYCGLEILTIEISEDNNEIIELSGKYLGITYDDYNSLKRIYLSNPSRLEDYRTAEGWSYYSDIIFAKLVDVIDSVFITNADMAEINLNYHPAKTLLTNYRFLDYYSLSENELMEAYEKYGEWITSIIYIANDEIYDESQIAEYLMTAQELFESVIIMTPDRMFLMDYPDVYASYVNYYSLGVRIGKQYMVEAEMDESGELTEYINNFVENYGYFPIIAPETYKNNVFFLMGISDVLGVPVKVLTMKEEIEPALETGELGKCLILDITHMESVYLAQGQIFDLFLQYEYDLADLYIFDSDRNALFDITKYTNHVFFYTLNYDILPYYNYVDDYYIDYNDFLQADTLTFWNEKDYEQSEEHWNDWKSIWEGWGYQLDFDNWSVYWNEVWVYGEDAFVMDNFYLVNYIVGRY